MSKQVELDRFVTAYIECAIWSSIGEDDVPLDRDYDRADLAESSYLSIRADCAKFVREQSAVLDYVDSTGQHGDTYAMAGYDFWLTRNGHGAGFWDGDWDIPLSCPELTWPANDAATVLTRAAHGFGESDLYVGDDGMLYVTPEVVMKDENQEASHASV